MAELQSFFSGIAGAISKRHGGLLSKVLALPLKPGDRATHIIRLYERLRAAGISETCARFSANIYYPDMISSSLSAACEVLNGEYENAYRHQNDAYNQLLEIYSNKDENMNWLIPALIRSSNDLRCIAEMVDEVNKDVNHSCLRESLNSLVKGFTAVAKDRTPLKQPGCKKLAIFAVTNVLFKIYFKVNTLQLCGKLISVIEGPGGIMDNLPLFPCSDVVMYKYYLGRLKMFEDRYEEARDCLHFALRHTPLGQFKNRQRILVSLIPVQMVLGVLPSERIAVQYGLGELVAMSQAVKVGDLSTYQQLLSRHSQSFIRIGVYLVLEHVKMILYRNLFRRVYLLSNTTRLNLHLFETVLGEGEDDIDLDEIECILCNLISQNRVKGYISHEKRFLIVSKTDPFPKLKKN